MLEALERQRLVEELRAAAPFGGRNEVHDVGRPAGEARARAPAPDVPAGTQGPDDGLLLLRPHEQIEVAAARRRRADDEDSAAHGAVGNRCRGHRRASLRRVTSAGAGSRRLKTAWAV